MNNTPKEILKQYWSFDEFRPKQIEIINAVLDDKNTMVLMPTGGGKSLCYQIPALLKKGICVVISPLIALMEDQVANLSQKGIKSMFIPSGTKSNELEVLLNNCEFGNYKLLYISPERLQNDFVKERLLKMNINLLAIDEAHCISEWGHDFRPAYQNIKNFIAVLKETPIIALTATATKRVQEDIQSQLFNKCDFELFKTTYFRENLSYGVYKTEDKHYLLLQIVKKQKGATIVYVDRRKATENITAFLLDQNISALPYHGGLETKTKQLHFEQWKNDEVQVMVATNAFGMGIDKSNVRTVVHMQIPQSLESYFQEAGRAGRDGQKAYALLLQTPSTLNDLNKKFNFQTPDVPFIKTVFRKLSTYFQISYGEGKNEINTFVFREFCERYNLSKAKVYTSLKILDRNAVLLFQEKNTISTYVKFLVSSEKVFEITPGKKEVGDVIDYICRKYQGVFNDKVNVNLGAVSQQLSISQNKVVTILEKLAKQEVILFENKNYDSLVEFLIPREDDLSINAVAKNIKLNLKSKKQKLSGIIEFVENDTVCKTKYLLNYFGEETKDCGFCSYCTRKKKRKISSEQEIEMETMIIDKLKLLPLNSRTIFEDFNYSEENLIATLKRLLQKRIIKINPNNTYQLINNI